MTQIGASKSILAVLRSRPGFPKVSASERSRLEDVVKMTALTNVELAQVADAVKNVGFAAEDEAMLLDRIAEVLGQLPQHQTGKGGGRLSMQNWEELVHYVPSSIWAKVKEGGCVSFWTF